MSFMNSYEMHLLSYLGLYHSEHFEISLGINFFFQSSLLQERYIKFSFLLASVEESLT